MGPWIMERPFFTHFGRLLSPFLSIGKLDQVCALLTVLYTMKNVLWLMKYTLKMFMLFSFSIEID